VLVESEEGKEPGDPAVAVPKRVDAEEIEWLLTDIPDGRWVAFYAQRLGSSLFLHVGGKKIIRCKN
jgi:hypothetical protein